MHVLNCRGVSNTCPKTGERVSLMTSYPDPSRSLNDKISKADLECGKDCSIEPCPIVEGHNSIY